MLNGHLTTRLGDEIRIRDGEFVVPPRALARVRRWMAHAVREADREQTIPPSLAITLRVGERLGYWQILDLIDDDRPGVVY